MVVTLGRRAAGPGITGNLNMSGSDITNVGSLTTGDLDTAGRPVYSVKHPDYGAVGDGTTDDAAAIQSALTDAVNNEGTLYFPPGTYLTDSTTNLMNLTGASNVSIIGAGRGQSQIKAGSSASGGKIFRFAEDGSQNPCENIVIKGLEIGPGKTNDDLIRFIDTTGGETFSDQHKFFRFEDMYVHSAGAAVRHSDAHQIFWENCRFEDPQDNTHPLFTIGSGCDHVQLNNSYLKSTNNQQHVYGAGFGSTNVKATDCYMEATQDQVVHIEDQAGDVTEGWVWENCTMIASGSNASDGLLGYVTGGDKDNHKYIGCDFVNETSNVMDVEVRIGEDSGFYNCTFRGSGRLKPRINQNGGFIRDCVVRSGGRIESVGTDCSVVGNIIRDADGNAIYVNGGSCYVSENTIIDANQGGNSGRTGVAIQLNGGINIVVRDNTERAPNTTPTDFLFVRIPDGDTKEVSGNQSGTNSNTNLDRADRVFNNSFYLDTTTLTLTGGNGTGSGNEQTTTITDVSSRQLAVLSAELAVNADPGFNADYGFNRVPNVTTLWDDSDSAIDVTIGTWWTTDPGSSNDVTLQVGIEKPGEPG